MPVLTPAQAEVLEFERSAVFTRPGEKVAAIRDWFNVSETRYYQLLNHTLAQPAAESYDPTLVRRLRRIRAQRGSVRRPGAGW